jgi:hypothetical protein
VRRLGSWALLVSAGIALCGAAPARAAVSYSSIGTIGGLSSMGGVAVDESTGNVVATYPQADRIDLFGSGPGAGLLASFGNSETHRPAGVAIDQSNGDVFVANSSVNELQQVVYLGAEGGTFTLSFEGEATAPIPYDAGEGVVCAALEALPAIGAGNVFDPFGGSPASTYVEFRNALGGIDVPQLQIDGSGLQGSPVLETGTYAQGMPGRLQKFVPDDRAHPTAYSVDPSFVSPPFGPNGAAGQIGSFSSSLAVDPATGDLLIADAGNKRVARFSSSGVFLGSFNGSGWPGGAFARLLDVDVAPDGDVYVVRDGKRVGDTVVERFAPDGSAGQLLAADQVVNAWAVAFDRHRDNVVVTSKLNLNPAELVVLHGGSVVDRWLYSGFVGDLAVDGGSSGYVYAGSDALIQVLRPIGVPTVEKPTGTRPVGGATANVQLAGSVDPLGYPTEYRFEYSVDGGATWIPTPAGDVGSGASPVTVSATVAPPAAGELRARLTAISGTATKSSPAQVLKVPLGATSRADHLTSSSALLGGLVERSDFATTYSFEYGTSTAYGSRSQVGSVAPATAGDHSIVAVSSPVARLKPATTYHYRLVAEQFFGGGYGEDRTFTTAPAESFPAAPPTIVVPGLAEPGATRRCAQGLHPRKLNGKTQCSRAHKKRRKRKHRRSG